MKQDSSWYREGGGKESQTFRSLTSVHIIVNHQCEEYYTLGGELRLVYIHIAECYRKTNTKTRKCIPTEQRAALTLWYLATNTDYCTIGHLFGVSKSTVCVITKDVCIQLLLAFYFQSTSECHLEIILRMLLKDLNTSGDSLSVLVLWMGHIFQ